MNIDHPSAQQQPKWSASLICCCEDVGTCCITWWLPCITFGQIAEVVDEGQSSCAAQGLAYGCLMLFSCHWVLSCVYRQKLRSKFGLPKDPCSDCCVHFCCEPCALCQEHAELKHRGLDPSRGWIGAPNAPPPLQMPPSMQKMSSSFD